MVDPNEVVNSAAQAASDAAKAANAQAQASAPGILSFVGKYWWIGAAVLLGLVALHFVGGVNL